MRLFVLARHAQSTLNLEQRVTGDPALDVPLTEQGRKEARLLGAQLANLPLDVCIHTRFPRTRLTAEIVVAGRDVRVETEPLFDDVAIGELEGLAVADYRAWKAHHARHEAFPGGESLDAAADRYALAYRRLLETKHSSVLVVCHEIPIRYALNGAAGSDSLDGPIHEIPNSVPFCFDEDALERAAAGIERLRHS
ncbi:MAG TPA: histidine phosphatase family protein [Gaiellaceae bacterium]